MGQWTELLLSKPGPQLYNRPPPAELGMPAGYLESQHLGGKEGGSLVKAA